MQVLLLGDSKACTRYKRQHGAPSSASTSTDLGMLRSLSNILDHATTQRGHLDHQFMTNEHQKILEMVGADLANRCRIESWNLKARTMVYS